MRFEDGGELVVSERVTRKSVRVRLLSSAAFEEDFSRYGPEPLEPNRSTTPRSSSYSRAGDSCTRCCATSTRSSASGARTPTRSCTPRSSRPFTPADRLSPEERGRLLEAIRSTLTDGIERFRPRGPHMVAKKHNPEVYDIHGHAGEACPRCGSTMKNVDFADHQVVYCPSCQTGGQVYADRRRSRLLK